MVAREKSEPALGEDDKDRLRVTVEICYSSTLDECWTLRAGGLTPARPPRPVIARVRRRLVSSSSHGVVRSHTVAT